MGAGIFAMFHQLSSSSWKVFPALNTVSLFFKENNICCNKNRWVNFDNWPPLDSIVQQHFCLVFHSRSQGADYLNYQLQSGQSSLKTGLTEDGVVQNRIDFTAEILPSNSGKWYAYDENGPDQPGNNTPCCLYSYSYI